MKFIKIALLLCSLTCAGQYHFFGWQEHIYTPADFPGGTSRIDIYEVKFNKKGRAKDSTIVRTVLYDKATNTVSYKKPLVDMTFKLSGQFIEYTDFKYQYDNQNRMVYSEESRSEKQKKGQWLWAYRRNTYEYNSLGKVVKHGIDEQKSWYTLKRKDTLWDYVVNDKRMYSYEYKDTLLQVDYVELDRDVIYEYENGVLKDSTVYSMPKYKDNSYYYDDNGRLVAKDVFARDDSVMTKIKYEHDSLGRVVAEYDDRRFYHNSDKDAEWDLNYKYEYLNNGKIETWYISNDQYHIQSFDNYGNVTGFKRFNDGKIEANDRYEYTYKSGKVVKQTRFSDEELVTTVDFFYNSQGFLTEERLTTSTTSHLLYYYK
jgi:hypothetical protein